MYEQRCEFHFGGFQSVMLVLLPFLLLHWLF